MILALATLLGVTIILLYGEWLYKTGRLSGEYARKFVHIGVGLYVISWPYYLDWYYISIISLLLALAVAISKKFHVFRSVYSVQRSTYGELLFALGIAVAALLYRNSSIFAVAILIMSVADGFAAIVGTAFGKKTAYRAFGSNKSVAGSVTFFMSALLIYLAYWYVFGNNVTLAGLSSTVLIGASLCAAAVLTLIEAISPKGSDNLALPIVAGLLLTVLR